MTQWLKPCHSEAACTRDRWEAGRNDKWCDHVTTDAGFLIYHM